MAKCPCGKEATHTVWLPQSNVCTGLRQPMIAYQVCDYHAEKAREKGFEVTNNAVEQIIKRR